MLLTYYMKTEIPLHLKWKKLTLTAANEKEISTTFPVRQSKTTFFHIKYLISGCGKLIML